MKLAKIESVYRPNLLVNGDFKINQRGQNSYSSNSSTRSYNLDMWCSQIGNGKTLTVYLAGKDGVRLAGSSISGQYFQELDHIENGKNHVLSTKIQIRSGNGTIRLLFFNGTSFKTKDLVDGYNEFDLGTENIHRIGLEISGTVDFFCNYIRLDEGSIAYPHIPEDYATALMRCLPYYRRVYMGYTAYALSNTFSMISAQSIAPMLNDSPTITTNVGNRTNVGVANYTYDASGALILTATASAAGAIRIYNEIVELSCEVQ